jgi:hypothetical protein
MSVEVRPKRDEDRAGVRQKLLEEPPPQRLVPAGGERLLELVDDQEVVVRDSAQPVGGVRAGRHEPCVRHAGEPSLADSCDDARSNERRLAATRRSDDCDESFRREPMQKVAQNLLSTEEEAAVVRLEREQATVGADVGRGRRADRGRREREDILGAGEPTQRVGAQIHQGVLLRKLTVDELGSCLRHEHLTTVC